MGSYLFKVGRIIGPKQIVLKCTDLNKNETQYIDIDLQVKPSYTFGRKKENDFARDDQHMSGSHANIYFFNGMFILEDICSTNGTWIRLSHA